MIKTRNIILLLLAGYVTPLASQITTTSGKGYSILNTRNLEPYEISTIDGVTTAYYANEMPPMSGSPYLEEQFKEGVLTVRDGTEVTGLKYRYDIFGDRMQMINNNDTTVISKPLAVKAIEIEERKFVYDVFKLKQGQIATSYFEIIKETESLSILLRRRIELKQDVFVPNYGGGGGTKEFMMVRNEDYYMKMGDGAAELIENKKGFLNALTVLKPQVKSYMKENRLSVKKPEDLKQLAEYYNSLIFSDF